MSEALVLVANDPNSKALLRGPHVELENICTAARIDANQQAARYLSYDGLYLDLFFEVATCHYSRRQKSAGAA